jgi:hypothetical protein
VGDSIPAGEAACLVAKRQSHLLRQDDEHPFLEQDVHHLGICQSEPLQGYVPARIISKAL